MESQQGFITHATESKSVKDIVSKRREKLANLQQTLQPFVIIVGPTIEKITTNYVVVDSYFYETATTVEAVDTCFKVIFCLNARYPFESTTVWQFIQHGLYRFKTQFDRNYTTINSLLSSLGLEAL